MLLKVDLASRGGGAVSVDFWRVSSHNTVQEKTLFFVGFVLLSVGLMSTRRVATRQKALNGGKNDLQT
jgi:hypothetical protein